MNLRGKKILFLSANFFGYEKAIIQKLSELGAEVDFFNERPSDSVLTKGIIRVRSALYQKNIDRYYRKIAAATERQSYDFFLLIKGETIPFFFLQNFRAKNPDARMIFYSYDSVKEYPRFHQLYPYFDLNFTFEPEDARRFNLYFRPLFFLNEYAGADHCDQSKYDVVFIGSAHTDRYVIGQKVRKLCDQLKLKSFFYYYAPGKFTFILKKIFDKNLQKFDRRKLSFEKLSHAEIAEIYKNSFAVLDINKPFQNGLSMRTFEALAAGKKLLTTNPDIKNYPFYNPENILVLNRDNLVINPEFFNSPFQQIDSEILEKMSLESFITCLFIQHQQDFWKIS